MSLLVGHLTDIHLRNWSDLTMRDFLGKRLTGYLNFRISRVGEYGEPVLEHAISELLSQQMDLLVISGDLSNLGLRSELRYAREFVQERVPDELPVLVVPGNHDAYTPDSSDGRFLEIYDGWLGSACDPREPWPRYERVDGWTFLLLNSSLPTPWFEAWGVIGEEQLERAADFLKKEREAGQHVSIVVHHHPSVALYKSREERRNLKDAFALRKLAAEHGARLIMHGHNHYFDVRRMFDAPDTVLFGLSSSISRKSDHPHESGQYALHRFDDDGTVHHKVAQWQGERFSTIEQVEPDQIRKESPAEVPIEATFTRG